MKTPHPLLRLRNGHEAKFSYAKLFFDLVYVFAVTNVWSISAFRCRT